MGKVKIIQLSAEEIKKRGINSWPIWTKEISKFDWVYECSEQCLILEGEAIIHSHDGDFSFKAGDFVTFEKGLNCVWEIKKPVRKYYHFE